MDILTLAVILGYTKKQVEEAKREGFRIQVEQDRNILETIGEEKVFYFLPKNLQKTKDGYDEFIYTNNDWEQVGSTDINLSSYATKAEVGVLASLATQNKSSLVAAINEIASIPNADTMSFPLGSEVSDG